MINENTELHDSSYFQQEDIKKMLIENVRK